MKYVLFIYMARQWGQSTVHSIEFDTLDACLNAKTYLTIELTDHFNKSPRTLFMRCLKKGD